jgi:hypothetical protein
MLRPFVVVRTFVRIWRAHHELAWRDQLQLHPDAVGDVDR